MTLMEITTMPLMMRDLLRMVGEDEVGRSREQGVDLRRFLYWIEHQNDFKGDCRS